MKLPGTILKRGEADSPAKADAVGTAQPKSSAAKPAEPVSGHTCPECKAPMAEDQDWCVQCGANDEDNMRARASWYSAGAMLAASAVLASGAAAAGVAALSQGSDKEPPHRPLLATVPNNSVTTTPTAPVSPGTPETLKTPSTHASTPQTLTQSSSSHTEPATQPATQPSNTGSNTTESTTTTTTAPPEPIELQAQDLGVYNPGGAYPSSALGDPRHNFEEGATTLWSVQVQPPGATKLNVGLQIRLSSPERVGKLEVITATPGYTLEVLGTTANKPPASVTASGWKTLAKEPKLKRKTTFTLQHSREHMRYVVLWITNVPASLAGSSASPAHVTIDEVALFPPSG